MLAVDTNLVVRYLVQDHPQQYARATRILEGQDVFVPLTVILETEWVLRSNYNYRLSEITHALRSFAGLPTVTVEGGAILSTALDLAEKGVDFADALHLGASSHCTGLATFDRAFVKAARAAGVAGVQEA